MSTIVISVHATNKFHVEPLAAPIHRGSRTALRAFLQRRHRLKGTDPVTTPAANPSQKPGRFGPPRIPVAQDLTSEQLDILRKTPVSRNGSPHNVFLTLAHHPQLLKRLNILGGAFRHGVLTPKDRELVILRVASVCGCQYEFEQHAEIAAECGFTPDEINQLREGMTPPEWGPYQLALISFTDDVLTNDSMAEAVWNAVPFHTDFDAMLELTCLIGFYRMIASLLNVTRVELEDREPTEEIRCSDL